MNTLLSGNNMNKFNNFNSISNYVNEIDPALYVKDSIDFVIRHKYAFSGIIVAIPIIAFLIVGFHRGDTKLGLTSLALLFTVWIFIGAIAFRTGQIQHYALLSFLILLELGVIIYFLKELRMNVSNKSYVDFYNPVTFAEKNGTPLSFYGLSKKKNEDLINLMKGTEYSFALKEDLPIDLGAEGTYSFWLKVCPDNFNKENTNWRTVWYRGDVSDGSISKMKTPGVFLAPNTNKLIISVACENGPDEGNAIVLDDIPLNNWFCITITLEGRSLDCYVNGLLEKSISLTGMVNMINSNIIKGKNGFNGLIAFFRYNSASITPHQINKLYLREKATLESSDYDLETCEIKK